MSKTAFRDRLVALAQAPLSEIRLPEMSDALMRAFLDFGSETEDNLNSAARIEYGSTEDRCSKRRIGLRFKDNGILLSHLMNVVEDVPLPEQIQADFPSLTEEEWSAGLRMITMVLMTFEHEMRP